MVSRNRKQNIEMKSKEMANKEMLTEAGRHKIMVSLPTIVLKKQERPHEDLPFTDPSPYCHIY